MFLSTCTIDAVLPSSNDESLSKIRMSEAKTYDVSLLKQNLASKYRLHPLDHCMVKNPLLEALQDLLQTLQLPRLLHQTLQTGHRKSKQNILDLLAGFLASFHFNWRSSIVRQTRLYSSRRITSSYIHTYHLLWTAERWFNWCHTTCEHRLVLAFTYRAKQHTLLLASV